MLSGQHKHVGVLGEIGEGGIGDRAVIDYSRYKRGIFHQMLLQTTKCISSRAASLICSSEYLNCLANHVD